MHPGGTTDIWSFLVSVCILEGCQYIMSILLESAVLPTYERHIVLWLDILSIISKGTIEHKMPLYGINMIPVIHQALLPAMSWIFLSPF